MFQFFLESLKNHHVHRRAGLPAKFWVTIAFLIVGFHLYLAKLIYSECFKEKDIVRSKIYMSWRQNNIENYEIYDYLGHKGSGSHKKW